MSITASELRNLRRKLCRPIYELDTELIAVAERENGDGGYYQTIISPTTQYIYRYLSEFVVAAMEKHSGKVPTEIKILDWGGGKGYVTYFLQKKGVDAICFETAAFPHKAIWKAFDLTVVTSADAVLPFDDQTFDAIVGFGVLEHVPYDYDSLKELNRVLKNDGLLFVFNLPNISGYLHRVAWARGIRYHDRLYSRPETKMLLKRAGFNTIGRQWFRQLLPKNSVSYPKPKLFENIDRLLVTTTPLRYFATSIEFVAHKQQAYTAEH